MLLKISTETLHYKSMQTSWLQPRYEKHQKTTKLMFIALTLKKVSFEIIKVAGKIKYFMVDDLKSRDIYFYENVLVWVRLSRLLLVTLNKNYPI